MSVSPLSSFPVRPAAPAPAGAPRAAAAPGEAPAAPASVAPASAHAAAEAPSLWDLLTPEERAFFSERAALGPLTYGPRRAGRAGAAPVGGRIDVRG